MDPLKNLNKLGLELPEVTTPGGSYTSVNIRGTIAYIAIQFPIKNTNYHYQGVIGESITTEEGAKAMELCALNVLAQVNTKIGFGKIIGLNHMDAYYKASKDWDEAPRIVDAASDLFLKILGVKGQQSRAIFDVEKLSKISAQELLFPLP